MSRNFGLTLFRRFLRGAPVIALLVAMPASAASRQALQSQEQEARKACLNGDYAKGTSILSDLFIQSGGNPVFIFNQARCFSGGLGASLREVADFVGNHRKTHPGFSCARRFDGGVEGQYVGLECDLIDHLDDFGNLLA